MDRFVTPTPEQISRRIRNQYSVHENMILDAIASGIIPSWPTDLSESIPQTASRLRRHKAVVLSCWWHLLDDFFPTAEINAAWRAIYTADVLVLPPEAENKLFHYAVLAGKNAINATALLDPYGRLNVREPEFYFFPYRCLLLEGKGQNKYKPSAMFAMNCYLHVYETWFPHVENNLGFIPDATNCPTLTHVMRWRKPKFTYF